jgi:hypothetical protein
MRLAAGAALLTLLWGTRAATQQNPIVDQLVDLAAGSVQEFMSRFSRVVAEERYAQEYLVSFQGSPVVRDRRTLKSDLLLVRPAGLSEWFIFRDTFEVDGRAVRDRESRLTKLFLEPRDTAKDIDRAREIAAASAQHNIRAIGTVDHPLLAIGFLQADYRPRFRFTARGRDEAVGADARVVEFRETTRPTLIRGSKDTDIFARGRYWIDGATGRMLRTEVTFSALRTDSTITTWFAVDDRLGTNVPIEMRFRRGTTTNEVRGTATYSRFRQFEVGTEEALQK